MKHIYKFIFSALLLVSIYSCSKDLDQFPISSLTSQNFYTQPNDFIQSINSVYNALRSYPDRVLNLSETRSDNLYAVSDGGVRDWEGINSFHKTIASNPYVLDGWSKDYNGIYRANELLKALNDKGDVITNTSLKSRIEAEAKFLRAFFYFDLVRLYGQVPLTETAVSADEARSLQRSAIADVYNLIVSDLQFAADNLPDTYAAADKGRATKYAAKGMLALVYMTKSAPDYGIKGPGLNSNEWQQALSLLNEIIGSGKYSLVSNYKDIFSYTNENNSEVLFDVQYATGFNPVLGSTFAWLLAPDTWFQSLGKPVQGGLTIRPVSNSLLNSYETADSIRKNFTIQSGYVYNGVAETRSFIKKYIDVSKTPSNRVDWPINFIVLRYTDILLLKAECILRGASGTQSEVDNLVNQIRSRARLTAKSNITLDQLFEERRKEFAGEGSRWYDLLRSGKIETIIPAWIAADDVQGQMQAFNKNYIIYPLPQTELDAAPGLYTQNDGY